ncbi:MAG: nickel-dependent hydrogenase large subunit, partial [Acidobacteria bacterium]|nr:nickel-dependent hydrogenase large subunit [Acidobacteriota bacterium]
HEEFEKFYAAFGGRKPVHHRLATHWARLIELLYAAERMMELATDPEITSTDVRAIPRGIAGAGVGSVEAPRGTLIHHYESDGNGLLQRVNLIVGTTNNHASIALSVRKAAERLIRAGVVVKEGLLNRIEMAIRLYDPCLSCATHSLPGCMPLEVRIRDSAGAITQVLRREG